jgi:hypothetical protein
MLSMPPWQLIRGLVVDGMGTPMKRIALSIARLVSLWYIPLLSMFWFAGAQAGTLVEQGRFHLVCRVAGVVTTHYHVDGTFDGDARSDVTAQDQLYVDQSAQTIAGMGFQSARFKIEKPDTISVSPETRPFHAYKAISIISQTHRAFPLPDGDQDVLFRVELLDVDGPEGCSMTPFNIPVPFFTNTCEFKIVRTAWGGCR